MLSSQDGAAQLIADAKIIADAKNHDENTSLMIRCSETEFHGFRAELNNVEVSFENFAVSFAVMRLEPKPRMVDPLRQNSLGL